DGAERPRLRRIADVDDGGAFGRVHVGDERHLAVHHHLSTAGTVEVPDLLDAVSAIRGHGIVPSDRCVVSRLVVTRPRATLLFYVPERERQAISTRRIM